MKKPHYAWKVCFAALLLFFCNIGLCCNILTMYLPFIEETGITGAQGSLMVTVRSALSLIVTFAVTAYYNRFSVRTGAAAATFAGAVSSLLYAFAGKSLAMYYIASALSGAAYALGGALPVSILTENWFVKKKGLAVGIAAMGSGLACMTFTPAITFMVQRYSLKFSYLVQTVFSLVCTLVIYIIVRDRPEQVNLMAYGASEENQEENQEENSEENSEEKPEEKPEEKMLTAAPEKKTERAGTETENRKTGSKTGGKASGKTGREAGSGSNTAPVSRRMQLLAYGMVFLLGIAGTAGSGHISIAAVTAGYTATQAGVIVTVYSALLLAGKFLCGAASDAFGTKTGTGIFMVTAGLGCLSVCLLNGTDMVRGIIFACLLGFGYAVYNVGMPLWSLDLSAPGQGVKTMKYYQIIYCAGGIAFATVPGMIADRTGEYKSSYVFFAVLMFVSAGMLAVIYNSMKTNGERYL